jgi:cold shock CspA family protein
MEQVYVGTIKFYKSKNGEGTKGSGFGFITMEDGKDVFFHISEIRFKEAEIVEGLKVTFSLKESKKGSIAINITTLES